MFRADFEQPVADRRWLPASRRGRLTALAVTVAATAGATIIGVAARSGDAMPEVGDSGDHANVSEAYPTSSASDWVTYGDHAVVVEMVPGSERRGVMQDDSRASGEGHIPRTATMKVDEVLWSRPGAGPAPETYQADLFGWWWHKTGEREFALRGEPRYEEGHNYIVLLVNGDDGTWGATLNAMPYDNGTVGTGEVSGRFISSRSASELTGLAEEANGKDAAAVEQLLEAAEAAT